MPISNINSVMVRGILSHERAAKLLHSSVAMAPVQEKRDQIKVPGGLMLHRYANLYFHARNPMLFKRKDEAPRLCVLQISVEVLRRPGTVITDCNAASDYVRFLAASQWEMLDFDDIFAMDWRHIGDAARYYQHKSRKCAEVLVPNVVESGFIKGAYVVDNTAKTEIIQHGCAWPLTINPLMFFRTQANDGYV